MGKRPSILGPVIAVGWSIAGIVAFIILFIPRMDMYWFILAPLIFAVYQIPAVVIFALWKKRRARLSEPEEPLVPDAEDPGQPPSDPEK